MEAGRKFWAFLFCVITGTAAFIAAGVYSSLSTVLSAYLTALGGFLVAYLGGNVAHKHVELRNGHSNQEPDTLQDNGEIE